MRVHRWLLGLLVVVSIKCSLGLEWVETEHPPSPCVNPSSRKVVNVDECQSLCKLQIDCKGIFYNANGGLCHTTSDDPNQQCSSEPGVQGAMHFTLQDESADCVDHDDECEAWAASGECVTNMEYMWSRCKSSCCGVASKCNSLSRPHCHSCLLTVRDT